MAKQLVNINNNSISRAVTSDYKKAICEYIRNGFDARATTVKLKYEADELGNITSMSITDNGGGINRESFRKSVINKMIINGLIATTHPENPNHRNQRYKLVGIRTGSADPLNFSLPYYGSYRLQIVSV